MYIHSYRRISCINKLVTGQWTMATLYHKWYIWMLFTQTREIFHRCIKNVLRIYYVLLYNVIHFKLWGSGRVEVGSERPAFRIRVDDETKIIIFIMLLLLLYNDYHNYLNIILSFTFSVLTVLLNPKISTLFENISNDQKGSIREGPWWDIDKCGVITGAINTLVQGRTCWISKLFLLPRTIYKAIAFCYSCFVHVFKINRFCRI